MDPNEKKKILVWRLKRQQLEGSIYILKDPITNQIYYKPEGINLNHL